MNATGVNDTNLALDPLYLYLYDGKKGKEESHSKKAATQVQACYS